MIVEQKSYSKEKKRKENSLKVGEILAVIHLKSWQIRIQLLCILAREKFILQKKAEKLVKELEKAKQVWRIIVKSVKIPIEKKNILNLSGLHRTLHNWQRTNALHFKVNKKDTTIPPQYSLIFH